MTRELEKYKGFFDSYKLQSEDINYTLFNHQIKMLELIARVENSSLTVLDLFQKNYLFVRSRIIDLIEFDEEKARELGNFYFFMIMHPEDMPKAMECNMQAVYILTTIPAEERKDYKFITEFRLRNKSGKYLRFIQQVAVLETDIKGNPWLMLMLHDLSPNQTEEKSFQKSVINIKANKTIDFIIAEDSRNSKLSKREIEILGLLAKGMMSKEIANQLFISVNTVNNHRQKIIEKMNVENTNEALTYAKKIGII